MSSNHPRADDEDVLAYLRQAFDWARGGEVGRLRDYLARGGPVNLTNDRGDTLLILAAYHVRPAAVALLLEYDAEVDRVNDNGQTALAAAVFRQAEDIVAVLLAAGAEPDHGAKSARDIAAFFNLTVMQDLLPQSASSIHN